MRALPIAKRLRQAEIQYFHQPSVRDENVGGLNVTMDDSRPVGGIQTLRDPGRNTLQFVKRNRPLQDPLLERDAVQKLHDDVGPPVRSRADLMNRANIRMIQGGRGTRFSLESLHRARVSAEFMRQELERHHAAQARILGLVHDSHAAPTQFFDDSVFAGRVAYGRGSEFRSLVVT